MIDQYEFDEIDDYIYEIYKSEGNDISDLAKVVSMLNEKINSLPESEKEYIEYLDKKRFFTKELLVSKARCGHDFIFTENEKKCKEGETPYGFVNVEKCREQYNDFIRNVWKPILRG